MTRVGGLLGLIITAAVTSVGVSARAQPSNLCSVPGAQAEVLASSRAMNACLTSHGLQTIGTSANGPCSPELKRHNDALAACRPKLCADAKYEAEAAKVFNTEMGCASREADRLSSMLADEKEIVAKALAACEPELMEGVAFFTAHCAVAKDGGSAEGFVFGHTLVMRAVAQGAARRARVRITPPVQTPSR